MGIPNDAIHVVISGSSATVENWSFGWWENGSVGSFAPDLDASEPWQTFRDELLSRMATDQKIENYDWYKYEGGVVSDHGHIAVSHPGTSSGSPLPLQLSTVLTLRTVNLSRSGRGRMYLPTNGEGILSGVGHVWSNLVVNNLVDKFAAFLSDRVTNSCLPVVVSRSQTLMRPIISVDADYIPDTQRRRRRQLVSSRHSALVS